MSQSVYFWSVPIVIGTAAGVDSRSGGDGRLWNVLSLFYGVIFLLDFEENVTTTKFVLKTDILMFIKALKIM